MCAILRGGVKIVVIIYSQMRMKRRKWPSVLPRATTERQFEIFLLDLPPFRNPSTPQDTK